MTLSDSELERYSRQLVLPEWSELAQVALRDASVLIVGAGALGSPVALYLARLEPPRWGSLILGVACLVIPVLVLRLQQIASVTGV